MPLPSPSTSSSLCQGQIQKLSFLSSIIFFPWLPYLAIAEYSNDNGCHSTPLYLLPAKVPLLKSMWGVRVYMTSHTCSWGGPTPEGTASVRSLLLYHAWLLENCSEGWSCKLLSAHMVPPGKCHQFLKSPRKMWTSINNLCPKLEWHSVSPFEWKQVCLMLWEALRAVYWGFWARSYLHHFGPEGLY